MSSETRTVTLLGSTGSIGTQVLDVAERLGGRIRFYALCGGRNTALLAEQARRVKPSVVVVGAEQDAKELKDLPKGVRVLWGDEGMCEVSAAPCVDTVVVGCQGFSGLLPTIAAAKAGKNIAVASKEALVVAGKIVRDEVLRGGARLVPIDSEHSALFQCLQGEREEDIDALILTASGGPFARASREQMEAITPAMALDHPTWKMGRKVTIDSATLMNKGLEILEAEALFGVKASQVEVVVHPRSIIHSLVRFKDGSVKAQLGLPDMRLPIQYALLYPERPDTNLPKLNLLECPPLEFHEPDVDRFPCLRLAREAAERGGIIPAVMSAADDVAVEAFLNGQIGFLSIAEVVEETMNSADNRPVETLNDVLTADCRARETATEIVLSKAGFCSIA